MRTIKGDLILKDDAHYKESLTVEGNIKCKGGHYDLKVDGCITAQYIDARDIDALDIDALDVDAMDIRARDIDALDVFAWDVVARNVDADHVVCEKVTLKKGGRVKAASLTEGRSKNRRKVLKEAT